MPITFGGDLGGAQSKTASATLVLTVTDDVPVGGFIFVSFCVDSDAGVNTPTVTVTDSGGNSYVTNSSAPGSGATARTGVRGGGAYVKATNALTNGVDTITITCSLSTVIARSMEAMWFDGVSDAIRGGAATVATGSGTSIALASNSAITGDLVIVSVAAETAAMTTWDSDTTGGAWSTAAWIATTGGGDASNCLAGIQWKIPTADGVQTFNATHASTDRVAYAFVFEPSVGGDSFLDIADDEGLTDGAVPVTQSARVLSSSGFLSDSVSAAITHARSLAEAVGALDGSVIQVAYTKSLSEAGGLIDGATVSQVKNLVFADNIGIVDALDSGSQIGASVSETGGIQDTVSTTTSYQRSPADSVGAQDAATRLVTYLRTAADSAGTTDAMLAAAAYARPLADPLGGADSATFQTIYSVVLSEAIGITDALNSGTGADKSHSDGLGASDSVIVFVTHARTIADVLGSVDSVVRAQSFSILASDGLVVSDEALRVIGYSRSAADASGLTDVAFVGLDGEEAGDWVSRKMVVTLVGDKWIVTFIRDNFKVNLIT